jgi:pyrroloquinoline-quinone synthase
MTTANAGDFVARLLDEDLRFWQDHPFHVRMHEGRLSREQLCAWVANRYYYQKCIPLKDAAIIANCPDPEVRRRWASRLVAQDGTRIGTGELSEWHQLGLAAGLSDDDLTSDRLVIPGVRLAADAYVSFARNNSWLEGVAASLTQAKAAEAMSARTAAFKRWYPWIDPNTVACFEARKDRLARDSEEARALLREHCTSPLHQERARAALAFKSQILWAILDALEYAHGGWSGTA